MTSNSSDEPVSLGAGEKAKAPVLRSVSSEDFTAGSDTASPSEILRGRGLWVLGIALAVVIVAYAGEFLHSRALENTIVGLESELASANAEIAAHEERMREVRGAVTDLSARLEALYGLVNRPVEPAVSSGAAPEVGDTP